MVLDRSYDAVIFDLNGTLIEIYKVSEYIQNVKQIAEILGLEYEQFKKVWAKSYDAFPQGDYSDISERFAIALNDHFGSPNHGIPEENLHKAYSLRYKYIADQALQIRDGVFEALDWLLSKGYKIGMISNCTMETPRAWPANPLSKYFPQPTFSSEIKIKKPNKGIFQFELNRLKIPAERCIYVADGDDHEFDTARELGMQPVLITYNTYDAFRHEMFPEIQPATENFMDLPKIIQDLEMKKQ